jgi:hypothetical protein
VPQTIEVVTIPAAVVRWLSFTLLAAGVPLVLWIALAAEHRRVDIARVNAVKDIHRYLHNLPLEDGARSLDPAVVSALVYNSR